MASDDRASSSVALEAIRGAPGPGRRRWLRRAVIAVAVLALVGFVGYTGFVGVVGADTLLHPVGNVDCRTPLDRYGWSYEAINYDAADDAVLRAANPDMTTCSTQGTSAGTAVVTSDGVGIAGWYIPAASGVGPTGTTVVIVHGWAANKSEALKYAPAFHPSYNVVLLDLRAGGRSGGTESTFGVRERLDVEAMIDWLERTKHPAHLAVMGNSMGGASAAEAAAGDPRIEALILDSTHARVEDVIGRRLEVDANPRHPSLPGTPAILLTMWLRTGLNLMDANPIDAVPQLGARPLLILHGGADVNDLPARSADTLLAVARAVGVPAELHYCATATHGQVVDECPTEWAQWATSFIARALPGS